MIIKPKNVEFSIIKHKNEKDDLLSPFYLNGQGVDVEEGDKAAIRLIIQLPKSSYATMALR